MIALLLGLVLQIVQTLKHMPWLRVLSEGQATAYASAKDVGVHRPMCTVVNIVQSPRPYAEYLHHTAVQNE